MSNKFANYSYTINNREGYSLTEALQLWRTKYDDIRDFDREVITHEGLHEFRDFVHDMWDSIEKVTIKDALSQENTERRRTYFDCIGVERLFKELKPTLKDKQVIKKKRTRWDSNNDPYEYEFEDVYELYQLDGEELFPTKRVPGLDPIYDRSADPVYAVRCWCTTTNREYWIYVTEEAATGRNRHRWPENRNAPVYDAIRAIAWTIRIDVSNPEKIYRQGDIIVVKLSPNSNTLGSAEHLTKDQYLSLMYSET